MWFLLVLSVSAVDPASTKVTTYDIYKSEYDCLMDRFALENEFKMNEQAVCVEQKTKPVKIIKK